MSTPPTKATRWPRPPRTPQPRSRVGCLKYFAQRKLCDLLIHSDHLSVYIRGLDATQPDSSGLVVGGTSRYVHAQVRTIEEVSKLIDLLRPVYEKQAPGG